MGCNNSKIYPQYIDTETQTEESFINTSIYNMLSPSYNQYILDRNKQQDTSYSSTNSISLTPSLHTLMTPHIDMNLVIRRLEIIKEHTSNSITHTNSL